MKIVIFSRIDSKEKRQLIQEYMSADANRKNDLEKRYGRIQMQRMVDTLLDDQYLRKFGYRIISKTGMKFSEL